MYWWWRMQQMYFVLTGNWCIVPRMPLTAVFGRQPHSGGEEKGTTRECPHTHMQTESKDIQYLKVLSWENLCTGLIHLVLMMCVQLIRFQNKIACIDLIWLFLRQNAHFGIDRPTHLKWVGPQSAHGVTRHLWLKSCLHSVLFPWDEITIFVLLPRERRDGWKNDCLGVWTNPKGLQAHELTVTRTGAFPHCSISQGTDINGNSLFCFSAAPLQGFHLWDINSETQEHILTFLLTLTPKFTHTQIETHTHSDI